MPRSRRSRCPPASSPAATSCSACVERAVAPPSLSVIPAERSESRDPSDSAAALMERMGPGRAGLPGVTGEGRERTASARALQQREQAGDLSLAEAPDARGEAVGKLGRLRAEAGGVDGD